MKVIIDRFEGIFAVCECEDKKIINIEMNKIPVGAGEGSVLIINGTNIYIDKEETKIRQNQIKKMMDDLWE